MKKWIKKWRESKRELAPQSTIYERRAAALPGEYGAGLPYKTIEQMELDPMIQTALTTKRLACLANEIEVTPADDTPRSLARAEFVQQAFERMEGTPHNILDNALDALARGWSVQELVFAEDQGRLWLQSVRPKMVSQFGMTINAFGAIQGLTLRTEEGRDLELPRSKFVLYRNHPTAHRPKGQSDLEAIYPNWKAKVTLSSAWRIHLERYASPTILGKFQRGLPSEEQRSVLDALSNLADNTAIVYPGEIEIGLLGGGREGGSGFLDAIDFHNREIARGILGETLTTDEGRRVGSLALGKVHLQVLLLRVKALREELIDTVLNEQVVRPLVELNFGPGHLPKCRFADSAANPFALHLD